MSHGEKKNVQVAFLLLNLPTPMGKWRFLPVLITFDLHYLCPRANDSGIFIPKPQQKK